jgi:hypothetical protein
MQQFKQGRGGVEKFPNRSILASSFRGALCPARPRLFLRLSGVAAVD